MPNDPKPKGRRPTSDGKVKGINKEHPVKRTVKKPFADKVKGLHVDGLNPQQQLFVDFYVSNGFNATQAAISAGYSAKTAAVIAHGLLSKLNIQQAIKARIRSFLSETDKLTMKWVAEVDKLAFMDLAEAKEYGLGAKTKSLELLGKYLAILNDNPPAAGNAQSELDAKTVKERIAYLENRRRERGKE